APGVGTLARTLGATGVRAAYGGLAVRTMRGLAARTCRTLALALAATTVLRDRRVQADRLARRETFDHVHLQVDLEHALDLVEQAALFRRHQRQGFALRTGTAGTTDAVDVVLRDHRQVVVDHQRQVGDVES